MGRGKRSVVVVMGLLFVEGKGAERQASGDISSAALHLALTNCQYVRCLKPLLKGELRPTLACVFMHTAQRDGVELSGVFPLSAKPNLGMSTTLVGNKKNVWFSSFFSLLFLVLLALRIGNNESRSWPCPVMSPTCPHPTPRTSITNLTTS